MKEERIHPSEEPVKENLDNFRDSLEEATRERITDIRSPGIVKRPNWAWADTTALAPDFVSLGNAEFAITDSGSGTSINVANGIAYNRKGERIIIAGTIGSEAAYDSTMPSKIDIDSLPIPQSTGRKAIPLTANVYNYIWIQYLSIVDVSKFTVDPDTGVKAYTRWRDGYMITVIPTSPIPPSGDPDALLLGIVLTDAGGNIILGDYVGDGTADEVADTRTRLYSFEQPERVFIKTPTDSTDKTTLYDFNPVMEAADKQLTLEDHVKAIGTAVISANNPHGTGIPDIPGLSDALVQLEPFNILYQKETHTNGIVPTVTTSLLVTPNNSIGGIFITRIQSGCAFYLNGERFDSTYGVTPTDGSGLWYVPLSAFEGGPGDGTYGVFVLKEIVGGSSLLKIRVIKNVTTVVDAVAIASLSVASSIISSTDIRIYGSISAKDLQADSVTKEKLNPDVVLTGGGLEQNVSGALNIKQEGARGSTANTAGVAREIALGTISTPDLRDAAVTTAKVAAQSIRGNTAYTGGTPQEIANGSIGADDLRLYAISQYGGNITGTYTLVPAVITTSVYVPTGFVVLVFASVSWLKVGSINTDFDVGIARDGVAPGLPGGAARIQSSLPANANGSANFSIAYVDNPAPGTHTYGVYKDSFLDPAGTQVGSASIFAVAIRR